MANQNNLGKTLNFAGFSGLERNAPSENSAVLNHSTVHARGLIQPEVAKHRIIQIPQATPARTAARAGKRETLYIKLMASSC